MDGWWLPLRESFAGFAWPWMWLALPLPLVLSQVLPAPRADAPALRMPGVARLAATDEGPRGAQRAGMRWWAWLAWALLCMTAARPQAWGEAVTPPHSGRDLMLALDLSGSMSEPDMALGGQVVDRLTAAKAVLADFLERRSGDRVGLLVFGQQAHALTPLTLDLRTVHEQLRDSVVGLAGRETAIGDAIGLAVKRLRSQRDGQRVLVLLTDGVNTAGVLDPLKAAEVAAHEGVRIHAIAFGGSGAELSLFGLRLPVPGAGGDEVDEDSLREVARMTGGRFFRARDANELAGIYAELDRIEPVRREGASLRPRMERYPWPLAVAFGVAMLGLCVQGLRSRGRG